jgi:hypothetical protein
MIRKETIKMLNKLRRYLFEKVTLLYIKERYEYIQKYKEVYGKAPENI